MSDPRSTLERESQRFVQADGAFERLVHRRDRKRRDQRIRAGVLGLAIAIAGGWLGINAIRSTPRVTGDDPPPTSTPSSVWSFVHERGALPDHLGPSQQDPPDAPVGWIDIRRVDRGTVYVGWIIELGGKPPEAADREPGLLIAYGLVLETTGDGVADYVIGIDNDAPGPGHFHVWVTDLATGETDEQIGPPYGFPIEFSHPDENQPGEHLGRTMIFSFLPGDAPAGLNPGPVRFYAWASAARGGEIFA